MKSSTKSISENITYVRTQVLKITLKKFSNLFGFTLFLIQRLESGELYPEIDHYQKLLSKGINPNSIFLAEGDFLFPPLKPDYTKSGHRISFYRRAKEIDEKGLSYLSEVSIPDLIKIELLRKEPTEDQIKNISTALNVSYSELKGGGQSEEIDNPGTLHARIGELKEQVNLSKTEIKHLKDTKETQKLVIDAQKQQIDKLTAMLKQGNPLQ